jgi:hypothetical protein
MRAVVALAVVLAPIASVRAEPPAKKDRERGTKSSHHSAVPTAGAKPIALVNIFNEHTLEWLAVDPAAPPSDVDRFLRDHFTNHAMRMDPHLIPIVIAAAQHFHSEVVDVVSAFRHPKFNLILRKKGHQVARDSQHTHGNAIDFEIGRASCRERVSERV